MMPLDKPGLAGGDASAKNPYLPVVGTAQPAPPDPFAIADLATDARPPTYACHYAMLAMQGSEPERPMAVCTCARPDWLTVPMNLLALEPTSLAVAMQDFAQRPGALTA